MSYKACGQHGWWISYDDEPCCPQCQVILQHTQLLHAIDSEKLSRSLQLHVQRLLGKLLKTKEPLTGLDGALFKSIWEKA